MEGLECFNVGEELELSNVSTQSDSLHNGHQGRVPPKFRAILRYQNAISSSLHVSPESASTYHYCDFRSLTSSAREALTIESSRITRHLARIKRQLLIYLEGGRCSDVLDISHAPLEEALSDLELVQTRVSHLTDRAQSLLRAEPDLLIDLVHALDSVAEYDYTTGLKSLPAVDAYSDLDSSTPPVARIVIHPPESMSWKDQMKLWDDLADRVVQAIDNSSNRLRIIVSVEPE